MGNDPVTADGDVTVLTVPVADFNTTRTGAGECAVNRLPIFGEEACGVLQAEVDARLCGRVKALNSIGDCSTFVKATGLLVTFDSAAPLPAGDHQRPRRARRQPAGHGHLPGPGRLRTEIAPAGSTEFVSGSTTITNTRSVTINNLENGKTYSVRVVALDAAGNESEPSDTAEGTPVPTQGFWGNYQDAGGQDTGGCSAVGGISASWALLALGLLRRRRS